MVPRYSVLDSCICLFITNARYEKNVMRGNVLMSWDNVGQTHLSLIDLTWSWNIEQVGSWGSMNICRSDIDLTGSGNIEQVGSRGSMNICWSDIDLTGSGNIEQVGSRGSMSICRSDIECTGSGNIDQVGSRGSMNICRSDIDLTGSGNIEQLSDRIKRLHEHMSITYRFEQVTDRNMRIYKISIWREQVKLNRLLIGSTMEI